MFLVSFFCGNELAAQISIKGIVADTAENRRVENASFTLITRTDSLLVKFCRSQKDGSFQLKDLAAGKYIYIISCPGYAEYAEFVELKENEEKDLGIISLFLTENLLKGIIVRDRVAAIVVKGDTIEFKADSFATREGATVEDLLKKLPGMQVDRNGNIQAFGKAVEQVLVDGEEFFGNDPTMATQNLKAESVDKVQVFDKKSDQATFTGVDDGETKRTINIQLKDEAKKGYFGKVSAGSDFQKYYDGQLMGNYFKKKLKVSGFAITNNYKYYGLGWDDLQKYAGKEYDYDEDNGYFFSYWESDNDNLGEKGFPKNFETGVHFSNKWKDNKHQLTFNYGYEQQFIKYNDTSYTRSLFPNDSTFLEQNFSEESQNKQKHNITFKYELRIDSLTSIKLTGSVGQRDKTRASDIFSKSAANEIDSVNDSKRIAGNVSDKQNGDYTLLFKRKFKKLGRTMVLNFNQTMMAENSDGTLVSENNLYSSLLPDSVYKIDQLKVNDYKSNKVSTSLTYTEPINKKVLIEGQYSYTWSNEVSSRLSYNDTIGQDNLDTLFSNSFDYGLVTNRGGLYLKVNQKKYTLKAGAALNYATFHTTNQFTGITQKFSYPNIFPQVNFSYKFSKQKTLGLNYSGSTRPPSLFQLQPLRDNSNPFNIGYGNPNLKQEFSQTVSISYNYYKVLSGSGFWGSLQYTNTKNDIVSSVDVDEYGKRNYQYTNVNGNYTVWGYGSYHHSMKKIHSSIYTRTQMNMSRSSNYLKGMLNVNKYSNISQSIGYGFEKEKKPEFGISYEPEYNTSKSSLNEGGNLNYWTHSIQANVFWPLPKKFELKTDVDFTFRQKLDLNSKNNNFVIWNASISRKVFKDKSGIFSFAVNDILKQRLGFSRNAWGNTISEDYYTLITRYWLLKFTWNFTDKASRAKKDAEEDEDDE